MKSRILGALVLLSAGLAFGQAQQQTSVPNAAPPGVAVYPSKNQSQKQEVKDGQYCMSWSKQQTGIDPNALVAPSQTQSSSGKSAVHGGLIGTGVGIITGAPLAGAAIGAASGAAVGHNRKKTQQQQAVNEQLNRFNASYSACMDGKGYSTRLPSQ